MSKEPEDLGFDPTASLEDMELAPYIRVEVSAGERLRILQQLQLLAYSLVASKAVGNTSEVARLAGLIALLENNVRAIDAHEPEARKRMKELMASAK